MAKLSEKDLRKLMQNEAFAKFVRDSVHYGDATAGRLASILIRDANGKIKIDPSYTKSIPDFAREEAEGWYSLVQDHRSSLLAMNDRLVLGGIAKMSNEEYTDAWIKKWNVGRSDLFVAKRSLFEQYNERKLRSIVVDGGYAKLNDIITGGILNNSTPQAIVKEIREKLYGLKPGEHNKTITRHAEMLMRTELKHSERLMIEDELKSNDKVYGVRIRYYGGPCDGTCEDMIASGTDIVNDGPEMTGDFWFDQGPVLLPPYHPNCHCTVVQELMYYEFTQREGADREYKEPKGNIHPPVEIDREVPSVAQ